MTLYYGKNFFFFLLLSSSCFGQKSEGYQINGTLLNAEGQKVYLIKRGEIKFDYEKTIFLDSTIINNGKFVFSGTVKEPDYYSILFKDGWRPFILDNSILTFAGDANEYLYKSKIYGSSEILWENELGKITNVFIRPMNDAADSSMAAGGRGDTITAKVYADNNQYFSRKMGEKSRIFISTHPKAFISLIKLGEYYKQYGFADSKKIFNFLSPALKNHTLGKELRYKIYEANQLTCLNKRAIIFSQLDTSGNQVTSSSFRGKYLLIDFWASWCSPCRAENPNLKIAYNKFKQRGFEILAVSLDNDKAAWTKAIIKDELPWTNVSDLKGWKNIVAQKYLVEAVPTNYLIDRNGKIIAKNLRSEELMKKLNEIFNE